MNENLDGSNINLLMKHYSNFICGYANGYRTGLAEVRELFHQPDMKHNRITNAEDNFRPPLFWQSLYYMQADLSNGMVLFVSRGFGSVWKKHSFTKVSYCARACVPL